MDLWVVAAATGAGYLVKNLHKSTEEKEESSESTSSRKKRTKFSDIFSKKNEYVTNENYEISDIVTLNKLQTNVYQRSEKADLRSKRSNGISIIEKQVKKGYSFSPPPSPTTPFGAQLIVNRVVNNRDSSDLFGDFVDGDDEFSIEARNEILGLSFNNRNGLFELPKTRKYHIGTLLSHGPINGRILFFAGITIGIISSIISNNRELDSKNTQLKQKESLVRGLHEEIEMRDRFSIKEIKSSNEELVFSSSKHEIEKSKKCDSEELGEIEAELVAELAKLQLKIASSELEEIYDYVELDPIFETDVIQEDLKIHVAQQSDTNQSKSANKANETSINQYVVSPWELTIRIHELIESRLEDRIQELELALEMRKKRVSISKGSGNSEFGFSETQVYTYEVDDMDMS